MSEQPSNIDWNSYLHTPSLYYYQDWKVKAMWEEVRKLALHTNVTSEGVAVAVTISSKTLMVFDRCPNSNILYVYIMTPEQFCKHLRYEESNNYLDKEAFDIRTGKLADI